MDLTPQLAKPSHTIAPTPDEAVEFLVERGWLFDVKWDGVRCVAHVEDGEVTLINRNARDITFKYPDVVHQLKERIPSQGRWVLDGELLYLADGVPDFERLSSRDRRESPPTQRLMEATPVVFTAFDLLMLAGQDCRPAPQIERAVALRTLANEVGLIHFPLVAHGAEVWQMTKTKGIEGIMAKHAHKPYRGGRQDAWVKIKHVNRVTCIVRDYEMGSKSFSDVLGAMHLEMVDGGDLTPVGRVGTGFSHDQRKEYRDRLDAGEVLIVEVEYANLTKNGSLRFPSFKGERSDVGPDGCLLTQLEDHA